MKNKLNWFYIFIAGFFLLANTLNSQEMILFLSNGKYGYLNDELKIIIPAIYDRAGCFNAYGYAVVYTTERKSEIIDMTGKSLLRANTGIIYNIYDDYYSFSLSDKNESWLIRISDNYIISKDLYIAGQGSKGEYLHAVFSNSENRDGFVDINGNRVLPNLILKKYSYSFFEGRAVITDQNWNYKIIDKNGNSIGNFDYYRAGQRFSEGLLPVQIVNRQTGYIDRTGESAFKMPFIVGDFPDATNFSGGFALIRTRENPSTWKVINKKGEQVSENIYIEDAREFSEGYSLVTAFEEGSQTVKYGYVNNRGDYLIRPVLDFADDFNKGYARIKYRGKEGLLNTNGKIFWSEDIVQDKKRESLIEDTIRE